MRILILGASSALAHETAKCLARDGAEFVLVARSIYKLRTIQGDLLVRGAKSVEIIEADLADTARHQEIVESALKPFSGLDVALLAYGTLGDQKQDEQSLDATVHEFTTNATSVIALLTLLANYFAAQKSGCLAVISSVAGDRGRQSNYIYGAAKAAVTTFLSGLRNRLASAGVTVITIKPGTVDTPMTAHMRKGLLFARAEAVGRRIAVAIKKKQEVVYVPGYWRPIMWVIKSIPEPVFKKLNIGG
jgi:short-subunit dehydrogenase